MDGESSSHESHKVVESLFLAVPGAHERASAASQAILCTIVGLELSLGNIAVGRVVGAAGHHGLRDKVPQDVAGKQVIAHLMN